MSALKFESEDGGTRHSSTVNDRSPSPLSTSQGSAAAHLTNSYYAPVSRLGSIDSDILMTDATDGTTDTAAAHRMERLSSPLSTSTTATTGANKKKSGASRRGGASSSGTGFRVSSSRGGSKSSATRGGSGIAKKKTKPAGTRLGRTSTYVRASASPGVKRGPESDDDDGDNEEEEEEEEDDDEDDDDVDDEVIDNKQRRRIRKVQDDSDMGEDGDGTGGGGEEGNSSDSGPYCICRGPDDHRWMIQCDDCEDWFHGECVNINMEEGENMIVSYICPNCTIPGRYVTRFRKLCSYPNCRKPARLYADDGTSPIAPSEASHFCTDTHRDQWWDAMLGRMERVRSVGAAAEAKLAVDSLTPAQLIAVLAHTDQPGVAEMLLHGLAQEGKVDLETVLTDEERAATTKLAADRYNLAEQVVMCRKMLQLLDMAKTRSQEAIKAGHVERDSCGYDERLQHVGVQPHFEQFLASPEGIAIFRSETLSAPQFDEDGNPIDSGAVGGSGNAGSGRSEDGNNAGSDDGGDPEARAATAGMCGKRKCKAHSSWFSTLARDVRMQIQEFTRLAAALRDNENRIRLAAVQRSFVKQHSTSEVVFVDDSDNSLTSLASDRHSSSDGDKRGHTKKARRRETDGYSDSEPLSLCSSTGSPPYNGYSRPSRRSNKSPRSVYGGDGDGRNGQSRYMSPSPGRDTDVASRANGRRRNGHAPVTNESDGA